MSDAVIRELATHGARLDALEDWQTRQNGHLVRTEEKVDKLLYWIMGQMAALVFVALGIWLKG